MQIKDIMTAEVEAVRPDTPLADAGKRMRDLDVGLMPVFDGTQLVGMLTDRDITIRAVAQGHDPRTTPVSDVMTADLIFCYDDQDVAEAAQLMQQKQIRRLLVLDRTMHLVGIVSLGDLAVKGGEQKMGGAVLEEVSQPTAFKA
ncbi:MAG: CBS domain-containing protein [Chloroflexota bacterium]